MPWRDQEEQLKKRILSSRGWIAAQWEAIEEASDYNDRKHSLSAIIYSIPYVSVFKKSRLMGTESFTVIKKKLRWEQKNKKCIQIRSLETQHLFNLFASRLVRVDNLTKDVVQAVLLDRLTHDQISIEQALVCSIEKLRLAAAIKVRREQLVVGEVSKV